MTLGRGGVDIRFPADPGDGGELSGYRAAPASGRGRGVLVVPEAWGLVDPIRDACDRLAREGFVALAPDLYAGRTAGDAAAAARLMAEFEVARHARDLDAAIAALQSDDAVDGSRVGAVGFCAGGQLALLAATRNRRIGAVVDFYGVHPAVRPDFQALEAPVLGIFGERDTTVPPEAVDELRRALEAAGAHARIQVVPGVGHAFMNDARPDCYDAEAATQGWDSLLGFLRAELA